jgi:protein-S-isoprenylcysteine O-methyltransferase Ste14
MWIVMILGGIAGGIYLDHALFPILWSGWSYHIVSLLIGIALLWLVLKISQNSGRTLARYGRKGNIPRMETNVLVTDGLYGMMRHPMHLGLLFFPLSIALIVGSPSFTFIIAPLEIIVMIVMIKTLEEKEAIEKFGDAYLLYKERVPMFCLSIRCIKELLKPVQPNQP